MAEFTNHVPSAPPAEKVQAPVLGTVLASPPAAASDVTAAPMLAAQEAVQGVPQVRGRPVQCHGYSQEMSDAELAEMERESAVCRIRCRRCAKMSLFIHFAITLGINGLIWVAFVLTEQKGDYVWPAWVTFGTCMALGLHTVIATSFFGRFSCCRIAVHMVAGLLVLANVAVWGVWLVVGTLQPASHRGFRHSDFGYMWPAWVSLGSGVLLLMVLSFPLLVKLACGANTISQDEVQREVERARVGR